MHIEEILMKLNLYLFLIKNYQLLKKSNEISDRVSMVIKNGFDSQPVYKDKYLKTKINSCEGKRKTKLFMTVRCQKKVRNTLAYW